jgi:hypothetical protein
VDIGMCEWRQIRLQAAAQAASIAGSMARQRGADANPALTGAALSAAITTAGEATAALNGFTNGSNGVTVTLQNPPLSGGYNNNSYAVEATIQQQVTASFLNILHLGAFTMQGQAVQAVQSVDLSPYYNVDAVVMDGAYIASGKGLDGNSFGIPATTFSQVRNQNRTLSTFPGLVSWRGCLFLIGPPSIATNSSNATKNGVLNSTITLPSGKFSQVLVLATTGYGPSPNNVNYVITYSDGATLSATRNMSDWVVPQSNNSNEYQVLEVPYRIAGGHDTGGGVFSGGTTSQFPNTTYFYGYVINLDNTKTVKTLKPPQSGPGTAGMTMRPIILAINLLP